MIVGWILNLKSKQMDFSNTFAQTELETLVYLDVSKDYEFKEQGDMILDHVKNIKNSKEWPKQFFSFYVFWCF